MMEDVESVANEVTLLALLAAIQLSIMLSKPNMKATLFKILTFTLILAAVSIAGFALYKIHHAKKKFEYEPEVVFERKEVKKEKIFVKGKKEKAGKSVIVIEPEKKR